MLGFKTVWRDLINYRDWIKVIKKEEKNLKSKFNLFSMGRTVIYDIYIVVTLPGEENVLDEHTKRARVIEALIPVNRYIDEDLQFAEYIAPEFNLIEKDDEPTLSYLIVYRFAFNRLTISWAISRGLLIAGLIIGGSYISWTNLYQWILSLI